jgi:tetratricopeptide (TPR) repeat protein
MVLCWVVLLLLTACGSPIAQRTNTGNRLYERGDYEAALQAYQVAQVNAPDDAVPYFNAAAAYVGDVEFERAAAALEQALETADETIQAEAYYNLGNILYKLRRFDEAVFAYRQALLIRSDYDEARYNLELTLLQSIPPSPTAIEQQTQPETSDTDPSATPTPQPGAFDGPSPTPPPQELDASLTPDTGEGEDGRDDSATPVPQSQGELTVEQAEQLLDRVQQDQESLREYLEQAVDTGDPAERDW